MEKLTKTKSNNRDLRCSRVWECLVFVLEAKLQNDQKLPKWNHRSRKGQCLSFSDKHSTLVPTVQNFRTWYISPQYHIVFDDFFETTSSRGEKPLWLIKFVTIFFDSIWDWYAEEEYDPEGQLIYRSPNLDDVRLDEAGHLEQKEQLGKQQKRQERRIREKNGSVPVPEQ